MASATLIPAAQSLLFCPSITRSRSRFSPSNNVPRFSLFPAPVRRAAGDGFSGGHSVVCAAVDVATTAVETKKESTFELQTLTTWLLKQEQAGSINAEMTIVLSSISMACKQIASLVQPAAISNLTGVQDGVNVQGEDQKKLDVISNEVTGRRLCDDLEPHRPIHPISIFRVSRGVRFLLCLGL